MTVLITGADTPLGRAAVAALSDGRRIRPVGSEVDLREPAVVGPLVAGVEAVVHLEPHALGEADPTPDALRLDRAARGAYVLLREALAAGVQRVVVASRLDLVADYPPEWVVDETWQPLPQATAPGLAPFLAELTVREFARAEPLLAVCLRLQAQPDATLAGAALAAALAFDPAPSRHRWWLFHVPGPELPPPLQPAGP
jgi:nucleoside-diphosphate-sugar epimerase